MNNATAHVLTRTRPHVSDHPHVSIQPAEKAMYKHILIATDGSELADQAADHGLKLAKLVGADVTLLRVTAPPAPYVVEGIVVAYPQEELQKQIEARVGEHLGRLAEAARVMGVPCTQRHVQGDQPWRAIVDAARTGHASLIVMASHGRRGLSALLIGSETQKVLTHSDVPVLVCR